MPWAPVGATARLAPCLQIHPQVPLPLQLQITPVAPDRNPTSYPGPNPSHNSTLFTWVPQGHRLGTGATGSRSGLGLGRVGLTVRNTVKLRARIRQRVNWRIYMNKQAF